MSTIRLSIGFVVTSLAFMLQAHAQTCKLTLTSPMEGAKVGASELVRGTTTNGVGHFWVFAHREGLSNWWPQGGSPASPKPDGSFAVLVTFGEGRDAGANFEVIGAWVDDAANATILAYVKETEHSGNYPGMALANSTCRSSVRTVQRR